MQRQILLDFDESTSKPKTKPAKPSLKPRDPSVTKSDKPRLVGQNATILAMLQEGPKTNRELAEVSLKYTSRISDLRQHGYTIVNERLDEGLTLYKLVQA